MREEEKSRALTTPARPTAPLFNAAPPAPPLPPPPLTGYQEIMTDPSYKGQFVVFTVPHIGNVGINKGKEIGSVVFFLGRTENKALVFWQSPRE